MTLSRALGGNNVTAALAMGTSNTNWGPVKLPFDFGGGCSLLVEPLVVVFVGVSGSGPGNGTASVRMPIPKKPKLKGVAIHLQWGVADPAAKGIGIAFSDAATVSL